MIRRLVKAGIVIPAIFAFLAHGFLIRLLTRVTGASDLDKQRRLIRNVSRYSRFALRVLGFDIRATGLGHLQENSLIVSNHMSYLDMMVIASVLPSVFVTSIDMGEVFFLGTMAEIGGSLFIERRHRERVDQDIKQLADKLRDGFHVVLFPEGTSTDGTNVLPFKRSLLTAATLADKPIVPLTLRYARLDGRPFSAENRDRVCWYGRMSFLPHLIGVFALTSVETELIFHRPIVPRASDCKDTLAKWTHRVVASGFHSGNQVDFDGHESTFPTES